MLNIVEKYSADTAVESDAGVIGIEYVLLASLAAAAILLLRAPLADLAVELKRIVDSIV